MRNGKMYYGIIDTGSEQSIVTRKIIEDLKVEKDLIPMYSELQTFGNDTIICNYAVELDLKLEQLHKPLRVNFLVFENKGNIIGDNLILGQNFIRENEITLDCGKNGEQAIKLKHREADIPLYIKTIEPSKLDAGRLIKTRFSVPYVKLHIINDKNIQAMIDTGSVKSTIEWELVKKMDLTHEIKSCKTKSIQGLTSGVQVKGEIAIELVFKNIRDKKCMLNHTFNVVKGSGELITLGLPFLVENNLELNNSFNHLIGKDDFDIPIYHTRDRNVPMQMAKTDKREVGLKNFYTIASREAEIANDELKFRNGKNTEHIERKISLIENEIQRCERCILDEFEKKRPELDNMEVKVEGKIDSTGSLDIMDDEDQDNGLTWHKQILETVITEIMEDKTDNQDCNIGDIIEENIIDPNDSKIIDKKNVDAITPIDKPEELTFIVNTRITVKPNRLIGKELILPDELKHLVGRIVLLEPILPENIMEVKGIFTVPQVCILKEVNIMALMNIMNRPMCLKKKDMLAKITVLTEEEIEEIKSTIHQDPDKTKVCVNSTNNKMTDIEIDNEIAEIQSRNEWINSLAAFNKKLLTKPQLLRIYRILEREVNGFAKDKNDIGKTDLMTYQIHLKDEKPVNKPQYRLSQEGSKIVDEFLKENLEAGVIEPCNSRWNSPLVVVKKPGGGSRVCLDLRGVNEKTELESVPIRSIEEYLDLLGRAEVFSTLDMQSAFNQIPIKEQDKHITAFTVNSRKYCYAYMPFGGKNALFSYVKLMDMILADLPNDHVLVYVDDVLILSKTVDEHIDRLEEVISRINAAGLKFKPAKVKLFQEEIPFLGHIVSKEGIKPNPEKLLGLLKAKRPTTPHQVKSFIGAVLFWSIYLQNFMPKSSVMYELLKKDVNFRWTRLHTKSYNELMRALASPPVLGHFRPDRPIVLAIDSSLTGCGSMLAQIDEQRNLYAVSYYSHKFTGHEKNLSIHYKETASLIKTVQKFHKYLAGAKDIIVLTDNSALSYLLHLRGKVSPKHIRNINLLSQYNIRLKHIPGTANAVPDYLSRAFEEEDIKLPIANRQVLNFPYIKLQSEEINSWKQSLMDRLGIAEAVSRNHPIDGDQTTCGASSIYKILSIIITETESYHKEIRHHVIEYMRKNKDFIAEDLAESRLDFIADTTKHLKTNLEEVLAVCNLLKIPILVKDYERARLYFPFLDNPRWPLAPLGAIIELREDKDGSFEWLNHSLSREDADVYMNGPDSKSANECINRDFKELTEERNQEDETSADQDDNQELEDLLNDENNLEVFGEEILRPKPMPLKDYFKSNNINNQMRLLPVKQYLKITSNGQIEVAEERSIGHVLSYKFKVSEDRNESQATHKHDTRGRDKVLVRKEIRPRVRRPISTLSTENYQMTVLDRNEDRIELLRKLQQRDPMCVTLREIQESKNLTFSVLPDDIQKMTSFTKDIRVDDRGILVNTKSVRLRGEIGEVTPKIVLPLTFMKTILHDFHDALIHMGTDKTAAIIEDRYWRPAFSGLPNIRTITQRYIKDCVVCKKKSGVPPIPKSPLKSPPRPVEPFSHWSVDFTGPYPTSIDGYTHVISYIDMFSRYIIAVPTKGENANEATRVLLTHVIAEYGLPYLLQSDSASYFRSEMYKEVCFRLGISKTFVLPYSPWANGLVERSNRLLKDAMKVLLDSGDVKYWSQMIPLITLSINNSVNRNIGDTSSFIARGFDAVLPRDLIKTEAQLEKIYCADTDLPHAFARRLHVKMQLIQKLFLEKMTTELELQHDRINCKRKERKIVPGSLVLLKLPLLKHQSKSLNSKLLGPFRVNTVENYKITVKALNGRKTYPLHISNVALITEDFTEHYVRWIDREAQLIKLKDDNASLLDPINEMEEDDVIEASQEPGVVMFEENGNKQDTRNKNEEFNDDDEQGKLEEDERFDQLDEVLAVAEDQMQAEYEDDVNDFDHEEDLEQESETTQEGEPDEESVNSTQNEQYETQEAEEEPSSQPNESDPQGETVDLKDQSKPEEYTQISDTNHKHYTRSKARVKPRWSKYS